MTVKELIKILQDMPEEAIVTIGDSADGDEATTVCLIRRYTTGNTTEINTVVNIDI